MAKVTAFVRSQQARKDEQCDAVSGDPRRVLFRAQFLGITDECAPLIMGVADLRAAEAAEAMREAIGMVWPPRAIGFRLLDVGRHGVATRPIHGSATRPEI
jgi:hypothetical protein